ncbi:TonB-dependent receptor [Pontibacter sp. CAU 1760]
MRKILQTKDVLLLLIAFVLSCGNTAWAQTASTVRGRVTGAGGEALPGVSVAVKGTNTGMATDNTGGYQLQYTEPNAVLVFSYVGYDKQEVAISGRNTINVVLQEASQKLQDVVIVGSRSHNRSATETPVAVDIIPIRDVITTAGQLDVNQLLQYVAPSFNTNRQSGSDGSDSVDPATLRGLGPDQTLVLVNGKRRHQSSLINIFGTRGRGNTGTDLNTIPASAIERIEVLRDGASAQYGSDAIAGVINIVLKSSVEEFTGSINTGITQEGDGENLQISGNYGFKLAEKGFANMTVDYLNRNRTNRPADPEVYDIYRRQFGDAKSNNFSFVFNSELPASEKGTFYAFGGFNFRDTDSYAWTREANSNRNIPAIYPNGFDPRIQTKIVDKSVSAGFRSKLKEWDIDLNNTFGSNRFHYIIDGTLNASLLEQSPTRFDAGGFGLTQNTTGLNFSRYFGNLLAGSNVAFGTEYRIENYEIFAGEEASYRNYGIIDSVVNGRIRQFNVLGRAGGSQGFPGFRPENELTEFRSNIGVYLDSEFDITKDFMVTAAARYERYSDFGGILNGKLASRFAFSDNLAIRGSISTGFRAPSLAQVYFNTSFTDFVGGLPIEKVIARNNSPLTRKLGIPALKQEEAVNGSLGFTGSFRSFTATVDGYYVHIKDRIVLTGAFEDTDPDIGQDLQDLGVSAAQFFTNAVDTKTLGVDVILTYSKVFAPSNVLNVSFAGNFNEMKLGEIHTSPRLAGKEDTYFGEREQFFLRASAPESKMNLILDHKLKDWNFNVKFIRFGKVELIDWTGEKDVYDPKITTDVAINRKLTNNISLTVGAVNLFDAYPTQQDTETESGGLWDPVQMGFNGAFYYGRLRFTF